MGSFNFMPRLVLNSNPPNLYLLNSWDFRGMPPHPAAGFLKNPKILLQDYCYGFLKCEMYIM
jgi:hypothetical protein